MMGEPRSPGDGSAEVMVKLDNGGVARGDNGGVVRGDNGGVVRGVARGEGGVVRGDGGVVRGEGDTDSPRSQRTTPHLHLNQGHSGAVSPQSYTPSPLGDHTGTLSSTPSSSPQSPHSATGQLTFQKTDRHGFTIASSQYTDPDAEAKVNQGSGGGGDLHSEKLRNRELKWLKMFSFWEMTINKNFNMVKKRCRKGIPPSIRARAWQYLCGSKYKLSANPGKFEAYLREEGRMECIEDIKKDLHRQFPNHEMFQKSGGHGQKDLFRVLKAFSIHNPDIGFCQGQAPIAAILLMHMPAEHAFWCLVNICENYIPGYYSEGMKQIKMDGDILMALLKRSSPSTYKHLKKQGVEPTVFMIDWFMCVFTRTLSWNCVLRVWDMFFCEGVKVLFRVGLVLLKSSISSPDQIKECPSLCEIVQRLRDLPTDIIQEDFIIPALAKLTINEKNMEAEHQLILKKRIKQNPNPNHNLYF